MNGRRRILVVDDHPIVRRGLTTLLSGEDWVAEVVEAATAAAAHREATCRRIDVVAMDVLLPDGDGVEVTRRIVASRPHTAVLMLTMADDTHVVCAVNKCDRLGLPRAQQRTLLSASRGRQGFAASRTAA